MRRIIVFILLSVLFNTKAVCPYEEPEIEPIPPAIASEAPLVQPVYNASPAVVETVVGTVVEAEEPVEEETLTEEDIANITALAKMAAGEYSLCDTPEHKMQCAAVVECAMWRVLAGEAQGFRSNPVAVVTQPFQFHGYNESNYVSNELWLFVSEVYAKARQVMGGADAMEAGCVLPTTYLWFYGTGKVNIFRDAYEGGNTWDWSWGNPYQE